MSRNTWNVLRAVSLYTQKVEQEQWTIDDVAWSCGDIFTISASYNETGYHDGSDVDYVPSCHYRTDVVKFISRNTPLRIISSDIS